MRYVLLAVTFLAAASVAHALTSKDRILIAEVKQAAEYTSKILDQELLKHVIEISETIVNARVADQRVIQQLQIFQRHLEAKLTTLDLNKSALDGDYTGVLARILDFGKLDSNGIKARLRLYTNDTADELFEKNYNNVARQLQVFVYTASPKVRQLSAAAQQSEHKLITAFNNLAFAGLERPEELFDKFVDAIEIY